LKGLYPPGVHELATFSGHRRGMWFFGFLVAFLLFLTPLGALPLAAGPCILPVTGEEPMSDVEREQPGRLAWNPLVLPGYDGLLLRPINRPSDGHFYQIVGTAYRKVAEPAAGWSILDHELRVARGGDHFLSDGGIGRLWRLPKGSGEWQEVILENLSSITAFDEGTQDFYVASGKGTPVLRWDGTAFVPAGPMPTAFGDAVSSGSPEGLPRAILTLPKVGGTFAVAMDWRNEDVRSLWFRPSGGDWTLVADKADLDRLAPGLRFPGPFRDADVSDDVSTVRLFAGHPREASVLLRRSADGWVLDAAAPFQPWVNHQGSGVRLAWSGEFSQDLTERVLLFFERSLEFTPPILQALDPGTLVPRLVTKVTPKVEIGAKTAFNLSKIVEVPGVDPLLVQTDTGWTAFDGNGFQDLPGLAADRIGENASIFRVGHLVLIRSLKGVFRLTDTLGAEPVQTFPEGTSPSPTTSITWLVEAGLFVVVGSNAQAAYTSRDFVSFEKTPSPSPIKGAVAALPDRPGMLLVGPDGLYTLEADCPNGG
jgi:hypothetical protein